MVIVRKLLTPQTNSLLGLGPVDGAYRAHAGSDVTPYVDLDVCSIPDGRRRRPGSLPGPGEGFTGPWVSRRDKGTLSMGARLTVLVVSDFRALSGVQCLSSLSGVSVVSPWPRLWSDRPERPNPRPNRRKIVSLK